MSNIDPDEIFLDAANLPGFDPYSFEGRLEQSISKKVIFILSVFFVLIGVIYLGEVAWLQVVKGEAYAQRAASNSLKHTPIFAERGAIQDRNGEVLTASGQAQSYVASPGLAHVVGYVGLPDDQEVTSLNLDPQELVGKTGAEKSYDALLRGRNGLSIVEVNVEGDILSQSVLVDPIKGADLQLSVDSKLQSSLYRMIAQTAQERGFEAGTGAVMDIATGELVVLTSYPEYDPNDVESYLNDERKSLINRAISGLYTPGSIIKPIIASGVLEEQVISPDKQILSTGSISIPNPYFPDLRSVFYDWKAHGWVDMRHALAVSSNVYFYEVGGGFGAQKGIGIEKINEYARRFGLGKLTNVDLDGEVKGTVPSPAWKEETFNGEPWRIGDTYNTTIGQYGFQVTLIQMVRALAALSSGELVTPTILKGGQTSTSAQLDIDPQHLKIVREGLRLAVQEGTAQALNVDYVKIAAKTGTAEVGVSKKHVNSWVVGFFPYETSRYAFAIVMERGPRANLVGASSVARQFFDWLYWNAPEYLR